MTWPESTPVRRWRILALAAAFLLAALVEAGPATAQAAEPPPVSCIADNPVDPLGPGFLLNRGEFTTITHPKATLETAPYGINDRGQIVGVYERAAGQAVEAREGASRSRSGPTRAEDIGSALSPLTTWWTVSGATSLQ